MKLVVEQSVNIMAARHMMDTWLVIHNVHFNALVPKAAAV
jgi:hypothetical protein